MQPTTHPRSAVGHQLMDADAMELRTQGAAGYVMQYLINRAITLNLPAPHWQTDNAGNLELTFGGPYAAVALDHWRRLLPGGGTQSSERRVSEIRWAVAGDVQDVPVRMVAIVPAPALVGGVR